jgi:hypothetical protein
MMLKMWMLLVPCCAALCAQESWEEVRRLRPGEPITVVRKDMKTVNGTFVSASDRSLSLRAGRSDIGVERTEVLRVGSRAHSKRWRNALIGAGSGVVVGAIVDGTLGARLRNEGQFESLRSVFYVLPIGFGAAIGAAIPSHPTIYRAP